MGMPLRVLIVAAAGRDTSVLVRELIRSGLEPTWERVDTRAAMQAALDKSSWDIVLAAAADAQVGAAEALQVLGATAPDVPLIVVAESDDDDAAVALMRTGVRDFVAKRNLKRLVGVVEREVRDAMVRREGRQAMEALSASEAILNAAVDGVITINEHGTIQSVNRAAERLFGYAAAEMVGRNVSMLMPAPHGSEHDGYLSRYLATGQAKIIGIGREVTALRKDGTVFAADLAISEVHLEQGRRLFSGFVRDLTEHKRAVSAIRDSEQRFHAFMNNNPAVQFMKDDHGRFVYINAMFERTFQTSLAELAGQTDFAIMPADMARRVQANDRAVLERNVTLEILETVPTPDGQSREWTVLKFPITDAEGRRFLGGIAVDLTEQHRAEARLRDLEKFAHQRERLADIGAITAKILHDLANPLAGLSMQAQLILRRASRDGSQPLGSVRQPVEHIVSEVRRLDAFISEFMDFAREQRLDMQPIHLPRFLRECLDLWEPVAHARDITLTLDAPSQVPPLRADVEKLRRVFDNLLKNAVEAVDRGPGRIGIRVGLHGPERVRISVEDTGSGIPETLQVFRLFETTKPNGTGLGLAIAKQIVQAHGGTIDFARMRPRGTVFHLEFPLEGADPAAKRASG